VSQPMRRLYVLDYADNVRRDRATPEEIRAFAERSQYAERLAHVTLGPDGEIIATLVTDMERGELLANLQADQSARLLALLDASRKLIDLAGDITGVMSSNSAIVVWVAKIPWAEQLIRDWATERGLDIQDESPPSDPKHEHWIRTMRVGEIVRLQWPAVRLGADAIAAENEESF